MDNHFYTFIVETKTQELEPVLIVGMGLVKDQEFEQELKERFAKWRLPAEARTEPFLLDFYLAKELCRACPDHVVALGATIKTELSHGCSGGVLGDPHAEPRSVNSYTEELRDGVVLAGLPGGPGFVCLGTEEVAWSMISSLGEIERKDGGQLLHNLALQAQEQQIPLWIGVADGSGYCAGAVGVLQDGMLRIVTLE